ncbi:DUF4976 domain-containing protein [Prolixibacteraceae bacterium JC049]|nr:DUF4976 domain-containing protein [Prolixibacteraceae bacterium JC049]
MNLTKELIFAGAAFMALTFSAEATAKKKSKQPNIIYILADDLGYGDLSCYGQKRFQTPNIDRLANEGIKFTQHYAGCTVCAPSRATIMTGLHTGHAPVRGNREWKPEGQYPIKDQVYTVAELLKEAGYATGAFGKWGLGYPGSEGDPNKQGFDEFYGFNCQRLGHNYYPYHLWHNQEKVMLKGNEGRNTNEYAPELIHDAAMQFMEDNKDKPFFMYYPSIIPHAELVAPERYMKKYRGKLLPEKKYKGTDSGPHYKLGGYASQEEGHAAFAAMISILDEQVGDIIAKLKELGIAENTVVIFTSDNGPHLEGGADPRYFDSNGKYRGFKRDLYEGGVRVPMLAWWPGKIKGGTTSEHISAFWDVMPTFAQLAGEKAPKNIDGISFVPTLTNKGKQKKHDHLYWEFHSHRYQRQAIRKGDWKAVRVKMKTNDEPIELYNLAIDPEEKHNVANENPKVIAQMKKLFDESHTPSDYFKFTYEKK